MDTGGATKEVTQKGHPKVTQEVTQEVPPWPHPRCAEEPGGDTGTLGRCPGVSSVSLCGAGDGDRGVPPLPQLVNKLELCHPPWLCHPPGDTVTPPGHCHTLWGHDSLSQGHLVTFWGHGAGSQIPSRGSHPESQNSQIPPRTSRIPKSQSQDLGPLHHGKKKTKSQNSITPPSQIP